MSTRKASEGNEVGDDDEEDSRGDKKEDKESSRRGAEVGDVRIRKKILESVREKFDNVRGESFRKKTNLEGSYNEYDRKQTGSLRSGSSGLPLTLTATLKRKVIEMKQGREEEKSSKIGVDKVTGHVEGLVMRMERMLTAGDDLNKEREIRFRESIESSYQSPGKRRKVEARQEAVQSRPRSRASPATRSRQTWPARAGLPSLTSKSESAANFSRKGQGAPTPALSPSSPSVASSRQWGTRPALPSTLCGRSIGGGDTPEYTEEIQQPRVHHLRQRLHHQSSLPLHQHGPDGRTVWTGATSSSSSGSLTLQQKTLSP